VGVGEVPTGPDEVAVGVGVGVAVLLARGDLVGRGVECVGVGVGVTEVRLGAGAGVAGCVVVAVSGVCAVAAGGLA
jgi:hypothetical protein